MNARAGGNREISLLPYLSRCQDSTSVGLALTSIDPAPTDGPALFNILYDSDPLTRVVDAQFVTDSGCALKRVFLLLQKDRYHLEDDGIWPLTNTDIDDAWQRAFAIHADGAQNGSRILLAAQIGDNCHYNTFSPLFYCKNKHKFFHPPCPLCGQTLSLCRDDVLLRLSGLRPYSGSTKRYLHCASCSSQPENVFYVRDSANDDPENLHNLHALIESFGLLREGNELPGGFPCFNCPDHDTCHGKNRAAQSRIAPFSFYPFYALIFDSLSLPALDFLPLLSGASITDLKKERLTNNGQGRISCLENIQRDGFAEIHLFPAHDEKFFLEVLYLKLSFLCDVFRQAFSERAAAGEPEMRLSIDRIWVRLPAQNGLLPSFWNFKTTIIDIVRPPDISQIFPGSASSNLLHAGLLWFHALLVNSILDSRGFMLLLKEALSGDKIHSGIPSGLLADPGFSPEQIFWDPEEKRVSCQWLPFWEQSIKMGFNLLQSAANHDRQRSFTGFIGEVETLRAEVKGAMLSPVTAPEDATVRADQSGDDAIKKIITAIIEKWRTQGVKKTAAGQTAEVSGILETIIVPPSKVGTRISHIRDETEFTETVVLTAGRANTKPPSTPDATEKEEPPNMDALPETIILSSQKPKARSKVWK